MECSDFYVYILMDSLRTFLVYNQSTHEFIIFCYNIFRQEIYNLLKLVYTEQLLVVLVIICVKYKNKLNCKVWALVLFS